MSFLNTLFASEPSAATAEALPTRRPSYEVTESEAGFAVTVRLPGVPKDAVEITDEAGVLKITGRKAAVVPAGTTLLYRETSDASYELSLDHGDSVDAGKTQAEFKDGVLKVTLAKAASAQARKITVA